MGSLYWRQSQKCGKQREREERKKSNEVCVNELFTAQNCLTERQRSWDIYPQALMFHSMRIALGVDPCTFLGCICMWLSHLLQLQRKQFRKLVEYQERCLELSTIQVLKLDRLRVGNGSLRVFSTDDKRSYLRIMAKMMK